MELISRQAAIDALVAKTIYTEEELKEYYEANSHRDEWLNGIYDAVEAIKQLPPAELGTNLASLGTDCISREQAIKAIEEEWNECCSEYPATQIIRDTTEAIEQLPPIQPEIVHCKDCDWWTRQKDGCQGRCALTGSYPTGEWFCGNAKRKEVTNGN